MKRQPSTYKIIKNENARGSQCWEVFGFSLKKLENTKTEESERIEGYASCEVCFQTYTYSASTGTRNLITHSCVKNLPSTKISIFVNSSSSRPTILFSTMKNYKPVRLDEREIDSVKKLLRSWICYDVRPFKIVDDGLKDLLQMFFILDTFFLNRYIYLFIYLLCVYIYCLDSKYGEFDIKNAVRRTNILSNHIYDLADEYRAQLNEIRLELLETGAVCVRLDLWLDSYRKLSYLGLTATFVTDRFEYKIANLCCKPYILDDQSGKNLLIVSGIVFIQKNPIQKTVSIKNLSKTSEH